MVLSGSLIFKGEFKFNCVGFWERTFLYNSSRSFRACSFHFTLFLFFFSFLLSSLVRQLTLQSSVKVTTPYFIFISRIHSFFFRSECGIFRINLAFALAHTPPLKRSTKIWSLSSGTPPRATTSSCSGCTRLSHIK